MKNKIKILIFIAFVLVILLYILPIFGIGNVYSPSEHYGNLEFNCNSVMVAPDKECADLPRYQSSCKGIGYTVIKKSDTDGSILKNCLGKVITEEVEY